MAVTTPSFCAREDHERHAGGEVVCLHSAEAPNHAADLSILLSCGVPSMQTGAPATGRAVRWLSRGLSHVLGPRQPRVP
jgi:hypothetical protein